MSLADRAKDLADAFTAEGVKATHDPAVVGSRGGPIVFVPPPSHDYRTGADTWQLVCLAGSDRADFDTFRKLAALVEELEGTTAAIESATPGTYVLSNDQPPVPAYLVRLTTD